MRPPASVDAIAALLGALLDIPSRLAALERRCGELAEKVDAMREVLPPRLVSVSRAAEILAVSPATARARRNGSGAKTRNQTERAHMTPAPVIPLAITPRNVEHLLGVKWRWLCELAERNGIAVWEVRGKRLLPAGPIMDALRREAEATAQATVEPADEHEAHVVRFRQALGMRPA